MTKEYLVHTPIHFCDLEPTIEKGCILKIKRVYADGKTTVFLKGSNCVLRNMVDLAVLQFCTTEKLVVEDPFKETDKPWVDSNLGKTFRITTVISGLGFPLNDKKFIEPHLGKKVKFVAQDGTGCLYVTDLKVSNENKRVGDYITKEGYLILDSGNVEETQ